MKTSLTTGLQKTRRITAEGVRVTRHLGPHLGVYATPAMVNDMEMLCREFLLEHLDPGEDSVGTRVDVQHLASTPEGMWVEITATISHIDRRAVTFELTARDALDEVGRCTHSRFVVDIDKVKERVKVKIAKSRSGA